jgi:hypothetical protein
MTEQVHVVFTVQDGKTDRFIASLQEVDSSGLLACEGYRAGDEVQRREAVTKFTEAMEMKLRRNDHKTSWRDLPIEALVRLLILELEEFKVADEFLAVKDARRELVDVANFALIVWDRLSMVNQDRNRHETRYHNEIKNPDVPT